MGFASFSGLVKLKSFYGDMLRIDNFIMGAYESRMKGAYWSF